MRSRPQHPGEKTGSDCRKQENENLPDGRCCASGPERENKIKQNVGKMPRLYLGAAKYIFGTVPQNTNCEIR